MKIIKPTTINTPDGSFARSSVGYYWNSAKVMTEAAIDEPRFNYNPDNGEYDGIILESAATNLLLNSETLSTQTVAVTAATEYTLSFYNTGSITLSGASTAVVTGTGLYKKTTFTFTTTSSSVTLTVAGTVKYAQLESGNKSTTWIKTLGSSATRDADVVTGSGLIYTSVTDARPAWDNVSTYSSGDLVKHNYKIWESLQNSNTDKDPSTNPTWWYEIGPDNQHAAFDTQIKTISSGNTKIIFVIKPGVIDSVALLNMVAATARVSLTDPTLGTVERRVFGLSGLEVHDWYQYFFFDPLLGRTQAVITDLGSYSNALLTIELEGNSGDVVSIAQIIVGLVETLGYTQYNASAGIVDYSVKSTDEFGNVTFVQRNFSKRLSAEVKIDNTVLNRVQRVLYSIRARPVVWIGSDDPRLEEALVVYGFYKEFSVAISYPSFSLCSLEVEGLI